MAVFTGYAQKHVSRLDSVQRLNEVVVLGNSQRSVIPSQQLKGEELQRLNRAHPINSGERKYYA